MKTLKKSTVLGVVMAMAALMIHPNANAAVFDWNVASGNWTTGANWNPVGPPSSGVNDEAYINNGGTVNITTNLGTDVNDLGIGDSVSATGNNVMNIDTGNNSNGLQVGTFGGSRGTGATAIGTAGAGTATGTLNIDSGRFQQVSNAADTDFQVRHNGTVNLNGSNALLRIHSHMQLSQPTSEVNLNNGLIWVDRTIFLETGSQYNMSNGETRANGANGVFNIRGGNATFSGGDANLTQYISSGTHTISGGSTAVTNDMNIGWTDSATLTVVENGASQITAGSFLLSALNNGNSGTLRTEIGTSGITFIDVAGDVTFGVGSGAAYIEPVALPGVTNGTWTIMQWGGIANNIGNLALAPSVDSSVWSFNVDTTNKELTVTLIPEPASLLLLLASSGLMLRRRA